MLIHLQLVQGCFGTVAAELSSCERDQMATGPNMFSICPFTGRVNQILSCEATPLVSYWTALGPSAWLCVSW